MQHRRLYCVSGSCMKKQVKIIPIMHIKTKQIIYVPIDTAKEIIYRGNYVKIDTEK